MKEKKRKIELDRRNFLKTLGTGAVAACSYSYVYGAGTMLLSSCNRAENEDDDNTDPAGENNGENNSGENKVSPFNFEKRTVLLNSGHEMPIIGIGTYTLSTAQAETSVYNALKTGMRLIDTADIYGNETGVGRGIQRAMQDFGIKREEIFVTTKLWTSDFYRADTEVDERLQRLGLEYIDLLLLHHTAPNDEHAYQAMERGVQAGKLRSIGISNFYEADVNRLMNIAAVPPAVVQNETHPYHQMRSVKNHIAPLGTVLESWFPLGGRGTGIRTLSGHEVIAGIASEVGKTPCQVLIRWHLQSGNIAIPGSANENHIAEDFAVFDFELTDAQMQRIDALDRNQRFANY
ncbi:MAG: aldo/keto reductase [Dysgonamonadaceae bacterium]|jgi:diketogulonate reductase-like aldo/keto reductase|nr:aldo/keto reductase [Dysgonamonadaceae bacterium]